MAKILCIEASVISKIKAGLKSRAIDFESLFDKNSSEERRAVWEAVVDKDTAQFINTNWERAAASSSKNAMENFFKNLVTVTEAPKRQNLLTKIKKLEDAGLLDADSVTATYTDLVSDALGVSVTADEIGELHKKAQGIEGLLTKLVEAETEARKFGIGEAKKWRKTIQPAQIALRKATTDMDKYMNSLTPTHIGSVITGSIFRGNMLLNIPVATINNISNLVQGTIQAMERRLALRKLTGVNNEYAFEYARMMIEVFHKTGYDMSREYAEDIRLGEHLVHNEGPSITESVGIRGKAGAIVRKTARGQAKIVFKYILGYSDVVSAAFARADSANVASAYMAKIKRLTGKEAQDYALDVFKQQAQSEKGDVSDDAKFVHSQAIADAENATWTNKSFISEQSLKFRDWLNGATGDLNLGFWNIPFVKTGANVIMFGLQSNPIAGIPALFKLRKAVQAQNDSNLSISEKRVLMQEATRLAWRAGLGTIISMALVGLLDPDDFFSAYDSVTQAQRDQMGLKKGVYNAIKIGDTWVSLDFFGPLGATIVGMMYAKKYGKGPVDTALKFAQGVGQQTLQIPGMDSFEDVVESWKKILKADSLAQAGKGISVTAVNTLRSRAIPGIFGTIAKGLDTKDRKIDRNKLFDRVIAGVPFLRETLPAKIDQLTGKEVQSEGFLITLLFGSRVKTANQSRLIDEISRLDVAGEAPAIADIERSSKQVQGLKAQVSTDKYQRALKWYGREYGRRAAMAIRKARYRKASDGDKRLMLNAVRSKVRTRMLKKFGFRKSKGLKR